MRSRKWMTWVRRPPTRNSEDVPRDSDARLTRSSLRAKFPKTLRRQCSDTLCPPRASAPTRLTFERGIGVDSVQSGENVPHASAPTGRKHRQGCDSTQNSEGAPRASTPTRLQGASINSENAPGASARMCREHSNCHRFCAGFRGHSTC